jgi:hypothetical protein
VRIEIWHRTPAGFRPLLSAATKRQAKQYIFSVVPGRYRARYVASSPGERRIWRSAFSQAVDLVKPKEEESPNVPALPDPVKSTPTPKPELSPTSAPPDTEPGDPEKENDVPTPLATLTPVMTVTPEPTPAPTLAPTIAPTVLPPLQGGNDPPAITDPESKDPTPPQPSGQFLQNGSGFVAVTNQPAALGAPGMVGYTARAIARWSTVPAQVVDGIMAVGVVAFHRNGIDRVSFSANGGPWLDVSAATANPDTGVV